LLLGWQTDRACVSIGQGSIVRRSQTWPAERQEIVLIFGRHILLSPDTYSRRGTSWERDTTQRLDGEGGFPNKVDATYQVSRLSNTHMF